MDSKDELIEKYLNSPENIYQTAISMMASFEIYLRFMFLAVNDNPITIKHFHYLIINALEKYVFQENTKRNLFINIPVGSGKSLLVEYFISWCFARNINNTFLYISHSANLISKLSSETKDIVENEIWLLLFNQKLKKDERSKINWSFDGAKNRTGLFAGTMGGALTGLDAGNPNVPGFSGALIIDDPMDIGNLKYELQRQECHFFYTDKLETRRRTPTTPTIAIAQRGEIDDLAGFVKKKYADDWEFLVVPALDENDKSFWEEKEPAEKLIKMRDYNPFLFWGQYQQNPILGSGCVIKEEYFKYYENVNKIKFTRLFMTGDTAQKVKRHNDYTVFCAWGFDIANIYLIDMIRDKWEAPKLLEQAHIFWNKWIKGLNGRLFSAMYIEDKVSGTGLIQNMKIKSRIPIFPIHRVEDKLERYDDESEIIGCGKIHLPVSPTFGFNPILLAEAKSFRRDMTHKHDDIIDNILDACNIFRIGFTREDLL